MTSNLKTAILATTITFFPAANIAIHTAPTDWTLLNANGSEKYKIDTLYTNQVKELKQLNSVVICKSIDKEDQDKTLTFYFSELSFCPEYTRKSLNDSAFNSYVN